MIATRKGISPCPATFKIFGESEGEKMGNFKDLTGQKFGRLSVIKKIDIRDSSNIKRILWLCKCDCGNERTLLSNQLITGNTKSCGCYNREKMLKPYGEATKNIRYNDYKTRSIKKNIIFSLSKEKFFEIITDNCFYCGAEPLTIIKSKYNNGDFACNGIDRINNNEGYTDKNVVTCCKICNQAKSNMNINDFYIWVDKIYKHIHEDLR